MGDYLWIAMKLTATATGAAAIQTQANLDQATQDMEQALGAMDFDYQ